ncbi:hypothetical protein [Flavobacterium eburneipallidum]|uniref:hypothetical protein n=1 Tax=Flavobacterium eburneipallidum TaxID=3003263 RepID=UPI0022AC16BC|nr:hypothetical protein [Flavobacterium eburneipallidum]
MKENLNELFFGNEAAHKLDQFKAELLNIEQKNSKYFENRVSKISFDKNDRLHNHYLIITNSDGVTFGFTKDNDLDINVQTDCNNLFNEIFNSQKRPNRSNMN